MVDSLLYLLKKYLWCVPSDTTKELRDVSLADHLQTTCALAACSYQYHDENEWSEKAVTNDDLCKMALVGGDISGIQKYIYSIATIGHGGVAKRLRGRSFNISMLTEACVLRILHALNLPHACRIISAGGQFYLLIPNTKSAREHLASVKQEIAAWLLDKYHGELAVSIVDIDLPSVFLKQGKFDAALTEVKRKLEAEKLRKFADILNNGPLVFEMSYQGKRSCPVCERLPAEGNI